MLIGIPPIMTFFLLLLQILGFAFVATYGFAWVSHFFVEHNKPATFQYPVYSFMSDWVMTMELAMGEYRMW